MPRLLLTTAALILATVPAGAAPTIVGTWVFPGGKCNQPMDTVEVRPNGIVDDGSVCAFRSVRREGRRVIWSDGTCMSEDEEREETLIADDTPEGLILTFRSSGESYGPLKSCGRR